MRLESEFVCAAILAALTTPAWGQAVTLADLEGAVVEASVTYQNRALWRGQPISNQSRSDWKITMGRDGAGRVESTMTVHNERGSRTTSPSSSSFIAGRPTQTSGQGGGHRVWIFNNGVLTMLRTYISGGFKVSVAFARGAQGLTCTIRAVHAREVGGGNIRRESPFGGS